MAIEKQMEPSDLEIEETDAENIEVEIINPDAVSIDTGDGGVIIDFEGDISESITGPEHDANLADFIDEAELQSLASELVGEFNSDRESRRDWARSYVKGLDLLGMKIEDRSQPWQGASGVFHPVLTEAVVRFQAQAMGELFPASGPVRTKIMGKLTPEKTDQADRIETEMNYLLTEEMTEYRDETEQMLFKLPLAGSAFKKVYYDPLEDRPVAMFVPAEDFVASYGASDLASCPRYTHIMKKTANEILELQVAGFYREVDLPDPEPDFSDIQEKYDELDGESAVIEDDDRHTILEMHVTMNMPDEFDDPDGIARPYVVTIDKSSKEVLAIRKNWYQEDEKKKKRLHFVHYKYLPGLGFYGTGLIHLIGGLAKSATSILRQLIDAGTLSNLPAGLKARGLRIKGDDTPLMPGEFRDVDVPGGAIRDSITFIPYKEPSGVLYSLLGNIVEEGRRIGSVADIQVGDTNAQAPVGTTLALMERSMKVMSGVQARMHAAMKNELRLLSKIIRDYMPSEYAYEMDGDFDRQKDFDARVDVIPVSDPNAATMAQRIMQYQAAMQLAQSSPEMYNLPELHRQMLEVLGIEDVDTIIPDTDDIKPVDPVTAVQNLINGKPVRAFIEQDHEAHIATLISTQQNPEMMQIVQQSPKAPVILAAASDYVNQHLTMQFRKQVEQEMGIELPPEGEPLPADVEKRISSLVAEAAQRVAGTSQQRAEQERIEQQQKDPLIQMKEREVAIKEGELQRKAAEDQGRLQLDAAKAANRDEIERERLKSQNELAGMKIGQQVASDLLENEQEDKKQEREDYKLGLDIGMNIGKDINKNEQ